MSLLRDLSSILFEPSSLHNWRLLLCLAATTIFESINMMPLRSMVGEQLGLQCFELLRCGMIDAMS